MPLEQDVQKAIDTLFVRLRDSVASDIRGVLHELVTRSDAARSAVRAEADQAVASSQVDPQSVAGELADVQARMDKKRSGDLLQAHEVSHKVEHAVLSRLLASVRRLDAQPTLMATLDTLTEVLAEEVGRAAVFVQTDGVMRGWRFAGFGPWDGDARSRVINGDDAGFLRQVIAERRTCVLLANGDRSASGWPPEFAALPTDRNALAVPILVGGEVMVVIYVDDVSVEQPSALSQWSDVVELLARHAGHRLEALTANHAAALARRI